MKKGIAFFDFDGTITTKDTLLEFIRFVKGDPAFALGFLMCSPWVMAYKLKIISNQKAKERVLHYFFGGMPETRLNEWCERFRKEKLDRLVRPGALNEIRRLKDEKIEIVIVSASPRNWIEGWAKENGMQLIASELQIRNGAVTGRLEGINCHGEEKVRRILARHALKEFETVYAYGDTSGDRPMLKLAAKAHYRPFR